MYDSTIAACQAAGFSPRVGNLGASTQLAPRITSTLSLVGAGLGITFVPASLQRMNMEGVSDFPADDQRCFKRRAAVLADKPVGWQARKPQRQNSPS